MHARDGLGGSRNLEQRKLYKLQGYDRVGRSDHCSSRVMYKTSEDVSIEPYKVPSFVDLTDTCAEQDVNA
jgi:hypothetical protein